MWNQVYNPLNSEFLSTLAAAIPVRHAAGPAGHPARSGAHFRSADRARGPQILGRHDHLHHAGGHGHPRRRFSAVVIGFFPIGWIVLNVIFLYQLTKETGAFETLQQTIGSVTPDRRLQLLLIAFCFGCIFFEGRLGIRHAGCPSPPLSLIGLRLLSPLAASGLSLHREHSGRSPMARLGHARSRVPRRASTGIDPGPARRDGRTAIAVLLSLIVPFWLIWGLRGAGAGNDGDLARDPCLRRLLCDPAIS